MNLSFKYRLYPNKIQSEAIDNNLRLLRNLYNSALEERIFYYKKYKKSRSYYDQKKLLPEIRSSNQEYKNIYAQCLQSCLSQILKDGYDDNSRNHHLAKKLLLEQSNNKCNICGLSEWLGQKIPLVLDHINGNSNDGYLSNLRVICNNCDALTPTYKSKNKGNGRHYRRTRYNLGKSY